MEITVLSTTKYPCAECCTNPSRTTVPNDHTAKSGRSTEDCKQQCTAQIKFRVQHNRAGDYENIQEEKKVWGACDEVKQLRE